MMVWIVIDEDGIITICKDANKLSTMLCDYMRLGIDFTVVNMDGSYDMMSIDIESPTKHYKC